MSKWDSSKTEHENLINKLADIRELIWESFPENQSEMIGCPYSVACYAEDFLLRSAKEIQKLKADREVMVEALKQVHQQDFVRIPCPDNKPGCLVLHYSFGSFGQIAAKALQTIGEIK